MKHRGLLLVKPQGGTLQELLPLGDETL
jgi:hypothetical protein